MEILQRTRNLYKCMGYVTWFKIKAVLLYCNIFPYLNFNAQFSYNA
jgi:hypothetical protein